MCKKYTVCFCFDKELCEEETDKIARENKAIGWFVEPVVAPLTQQLAYRGKIVKEVM